MPGQSVLVRHGPGDFLVSTAASGKWLHLSTAPLESDQSHGSLSCNLTFVPVSAQTDLLIWPRTLNTAKQTKEPDSLECSRGIGGSSVLVRSPVGGSRGPSWVIASQPDSDHGGHPRNRDPQGHEKRKSLISSVGSPHIFRNLQIFEPNPQKGGYPGPDGHHHCPVLPNRLERTRSQSLMPVSIGDH